MNSGLILIVDDEPQIRKLLEITLGNSGYATVGAATGREGMALAANRPPDAVLLDLGLPDMDGQELLCELREWYTGPVIILSVRNGEEDIVRALDEGANDYLVKPFRTGELLARIRSAMRAARDTDAEPQIQAGNMEIDLAAHTVKRDGQLLKLTATEYALLSLFVRNEGRVLTHHYLLKEVWGPGYVSQSQYLRVYVAQLRKKIEQDANRPVHLITESGVGYRWMNGG
ncbi:MAG: response regulator [Flavipsychrobacter sp.]|nr:response regulator [Flavipsychrobacter sp.]